MIAATTMVPAKGATGNARAVLEEAAAVAGGETWLEPRTLVLEGTADFYAPDKPGVVMHADDYRMWRAMDPNRQLAHGADGKVRILARQGEATLFEIGFDGTTTWNDKGLVPKAEADAFWATNFGFGVIRQALKEGFSLESAPTRTVDGHALDMIRVIDPSGQATLFGIDRQSRFVRYMGFSSPLGWHERVYDDFVVLENPRWLQAREVTLFYNGVRANTVHWKVARVNEALPTETFAVPVRFQRKSHE
ncbi:MAG: hypothetical protein ACK4NZ_05695 [Tsuneonella sp.]